MVKETILEFDQVTKIYNEFNKVSDINFQVKKGECLALCGGNGAGKSTIIKMLVGILSPTSGSIKMNGVKVSADQKEHKRFFGYMPDSMFFPSSLTGNEVLHFFSKLHRLKQRNTDELLEKVGLLKDKDKKVSNYSKGMQQRLVFAQALLSDPPILILDEPTNGLDPYWVLEFKKIIKEYQNKGTTIILSSHILSDVEELADKVAFLNKGQLLECKEVQQFCNANDGLVRMDIKIRENINRDETLNRIFAEHRAEVMKVYDNWMYLRIPKEERLKLIDHLNQENFEIVDFLSRPQQLEDVYFSLVKQ